jgi:hypothetical protein
MICARALIENLHRYSSDQRTPWIHLMDGGISDNLALRVLLNDMLLLDTRMGSGRGRSVAGAPHSGDQRRRPIGAKPQLAAPTHRQRAGADHFGG